LEGEFRYISEERFLIYERGKEKKQLLEGKYLTLWM